MPFLFSTTSNSMSVIKTPVSFSLSFSLTNNIVRSPCGMTVGRTALHVVHHLTGKKQKTNTCEVNLQNILIPPISRWILPCDKTDIPRLAFFQFSLSLRSTYEKNVTVRFPEFCSKALLTMGLFVLKNNLR